MALTESQELPLASIAPHFKLRSTTGEWVALDDFSGGYGLVVMFICNHCPYVIHIAPALSLLAEKYMAKGIHFVAINSNDVTAYPADSYENMQREVALRRYPFQYLFDETQEVAHAYRAACTPDIYLFDRQFKLFYHGQFDGSRPHRIASGNYDSSGSPATGEDLAYAMDCLLQGKVIERQTYPAMGCNIKWKT